MFIDWETLGVALGLALVLEGAPYFLFAERMPKFLALMASQRPGTLRLTGLLAMGLGLGLMALIRAM